MSLGSAALKRAFWDTEYNCLNGAVESKLMIETRITARDHPGRQMDLRLGKGRVAQLYKTEWEEIREAMV